MLHPAFPLTNYLFTENGEIGVIIKAISEVGRLTGICESVPPGKRFEAAKQVPAFENLVNLQVDIPLNESWFIINYLDSLRMLDVPGSLSGVVVAKSTTFVGYGHQFFTLVAKQPSCSLVPMLSSHMTARPVKGPLADMQPSPEDLAYIGGSNRQWGYLPVVVVVAFASHIHDFTIPD